MIFTVWVYENNDEDARVFKFFTLRKAIDCLRERAAHGEVHIELCVDLYDEPTEVIYEYWKARYISD